MSEHLDKAQLLDAGLGAIGVKRLHHLGVAVASIESALPFYEECLGCRLASGPFNDPIQQVTVCFLDLGQTQGASLELVQPLDNESPVNTLLQKSVGAYHLCYEVRNIARAIESARALRCVVVREPLPAVAFGGRPIAWLYTPTRHLIEILGP